MISANASAALRCKSTLSEKERVVNAVSGEPWKKLVVVRSMCSCEPKLALPMLNTYFLDIGEGLRLPLVHSREEEAHTAEISWNGLVEICEGDSSPY